MNGHLGQDYGYSLFIVRLLPHIADVLPGIKKGAGAPKGGDEAIYAITAGGSAA